MWRILTRRDGADRVPRTKLFRQLAADQIPAKCTKVRPQLGFENEYSHVGTSLQRYIIVVIGCRVRHGASSPAELVALRRPRARSGPFVLVAKNQTALVEIIRRHFDRHSVTGKRFDPVLLHSPGCIGDDLMTAIELNAVSGVGQNLDHQTVKLEEFFFGHGVTLLKACSAAGRPPLRHDRGSRRRNAIAPMLSVDPLFGSSEALTGAALLP